MENRLLPKGYILKQFCDDAEILTIHSALEKCLSIKGCVDIDLTASLAKATRGETLASLRGEIFFDPEKQAYVTSEEYLSGNILHKLNSAKAAAAGGADYAQNIDALEAVMPRPVEANEIRASIGSPWIPEWVYRDFITALIGIRSLSGRFGISVEYIKPANHYIIHGKKQFREFTRAKLTYGTDRMNAFEIIERLLNSREITVYDSFQTADGPHPVRRINHAETLLAQERAKQIEERFHYWLFKDEPRRSALLNLYNEEFCAVRPRVFNGSYLDLPGKTPSIRLQKFQLDAVSRIIHSRNVLLAHQVGAGKTYIMIAAAMELRRLGISKKNLFVVPNNILDQWSNEFSTLYPCASVLTIEPRFFTPARRNQALMDIKSSEYDAVIMGYGSFALIPLSKFERERELVEALAQISRALHDSMYNDAYIVLNRYAVRLERRLHKLWTSEPSMPKDSICFDELGFDTIFLDEAQNYKNISIETKNGSLPGLNTKGSKRCDDMMAKIRFIQRTHGGRGAVFATGTPITNSVSDMYTMQRYLDYAHLERLNLLEFDNWVKMFSQVTEEFEVEANGVDYRLRKRLSKYYNLPELSLLFSDIADLHFDNGDSQSPQSVQYINSIVPATDALRRYISELADRADKVKSGLVPRTEDNMLKITTDGRKAALDMRLVDPAAPDNPDSKLNTCVKNVYKIWKDNVKLTQLVFLDQSTPKDGFNLYDDMLDKLVMNGVPRKEIAFVHDAVTDEMRTALFNRVRKGRIRILIGSTFKLGIGANVQDNLLAVHHLDIPWRPSDVTQREGRMLRQGNSNEEVMIYRYITNGSFDAYSWQLLENKQRFISQIISGDYFGRSGDEVDEVVLTYSEVKSLAVGNPLIKRRIELETELQRNITLRARQERARKEAREQLLAIPARQRDYTDALSRLQTDKITAQKHSDAFRMELGGIAYTRRRDAGERLIELITEHAYIRSDMHIGSFRGFELLLSNDAIGARRIILIKGRGTYVCEISESSLGIVAKLENAIGTIPSRIEKVKAQISKLDQDREALEAEISKEYRFETLISQLRSQLRRINRELGLI